MNGWGGGSRGASRQGLGVWQQGWDCSFAGAEGGAIVSGEREQGALGGSVGEQGRVGVRGEGLPEPLALLPRTPATHLIPASCLLRPCPLRRGPNGIWTLQRSKKPLPAMKTTFVAARPSYTHQARPSRNVDMLVASAVHTLPVIDGAGGGEHRQCGVLVTPAPCTPSPHAQALLALYNCGKLSFLVRCWGCRCRRLTTL